MEKYNRFICRFTNLILILLRLRSFPRSFLLIQGDHSSILKIVLLSICLLSLKSLQSSPHWPLFLLEAFEQPLVLGSF